MTNENHYECDCCGACCETFPVRVSLADGVREPRIAQEALVLPRWQQTAEYHYALHPLPFCDGCLLLSQDKKCTVYATRPDVCRGFLAGSEECQEARKRKGLGVLAALTV
jgi:Fe-S-cluster containining protein